MLVKVPLFFGGGGFFWVRYRNKGTIFVEDVCWVKKPPGTAKGKINRKRLFVHVLTKAHIVWIGWVTGKKNTY